MFFIVSEIPPASGGACFTKFSFSVEELLRRVREGFYREQYLGAVFFYGDFLSPDEHSADLSFFVLDDLRSTDISYGGIVCSFSFFCAGVHVQFFPCASAVSRIFAAW